MKKTIRFRELAQLYKASLQHEKAVPCFNHTEKLIFVQHSSEYETLDSDRKVNRNLYLAEINLGSLFDRYPTFHTLTSVGRN